MHVCELRVLDAAGFGADFLPQPRVVTLCGLYLLTLHSDRGSALTLTERILGVTCGGNCLKDLLFLSGLHLLPLGAAFFLSVAGTDVDVLKPVKAFERNISFNAFVLFWFLWGLFLKIRRTQLSYVALALMLTIHTDLRPVG